jgi:hypothetical protein
MERTNILYVFAGNMREVDLYQQYRSLNPHLIRFVKTQADIRALRFDPPINMPVIGSFWERKDSLMIQWLANQVGINLVPEEIVPRGLLGQK